MRQHPLGIYEKALPKNLSWPERLVLAKSCGFDFVEMSVDETDERLSRLDWVITFATQPPVQDSAVVIVAPRCLSARPTISLSCINSWSVILAPGIRKTCCTR